MKRVKRSLLLLLCAAALLPLLTAGGYRTDNTATAASGTDKNVRVGLCVPENGSSVFVSSAQCEGGFTVGTSSGTGFSALFTVSASGLALLPNRNASLTFSGQTASGRASDSGSYGAYHIRTGKTYTGYLDAQTAANRYTNGFVAFGNGTYEVWYGAFLSESEAKAAISGNALSVAAPADNSIAAYNCETGKLLFVYVGDQPLAIRAANGGTVSLNTESGRYDYPGFFEYTVASSRLKIINVLDLETYVKCVMSNEIGTNVSRETRRAFSVLIRTVPLTSKHAASGYDVCNTSCCQVYLGTYRRDSENDAIVDSTKGEYITYEGNPIYCLYHGSNGGASCSSVAAWGGEEIPYLKSVTLQESEDNASEIWQYVFSEQELYTFLSSRSAFRELTGGINSVTVAETDPYGSGYVTLLSVTDSQNNTVNVATSEEVRKVLRFESANFTVSYSMEATVIDADGNVTEADVSGYLDEQGLYHSFDSFEQNYAVTGTEKTVGADHIIFDGVGTGHGVGFSANGSEQLVSEGYSYRYIIGFYFDGTEISHLS